MATEASSKSEAGSEFYANYSDYNKALRTWLLSFSLGTLAIFLTNKDLAAALKKSGHFSTLVIVFLGGGIIQVAIAMLNKFASWHIYNAHQNPALEYPLWEKINGAFWLDMMADIATVALFSIGIGIIIWNLVLS